MVSAGELGPETRGLSPCGVCGREIAGDTTADMIVGICPVLDSRLAGT
jgi:hypothetical protein